jgi:uracil-DNA glycosylase
MLSMDQGSFKLSARRRRYLAAMGIEIWPTKSGEAPAASALSARAVSQSDQAQPETGDFSSSCLDLKSVSQLNWHDLQRAVSVCTQCDLHLKRTQTVFGVGNTHADLLVVGEAPGATEDQQGQPFVGRAGKLLDAMLAAINFERNQVFIANIVKCRPPDNRDPSGGEAAACRAYLERQIDLIEPKVILAVGRIAAQSLLEIDLPIGKLRGTVHLMPQRGLPLIVTYHPAYLLRSPKDKAKAWQDLKQVSLLVRG